MPGALDTQNRTVDASLELKASGALTASAALVATGGAAVPILDLGPGYCEAEVEIDVSAMVVSAACIYDIILCGTVSDATFGTDTNIEEVAQLSLGDVAARRSDANAPDDGTGRYILPFTNGRNGHYFRYFRVYTVVAGSGASITFAARVVKKRGMGD